VIGWEDARGSLGAAAMRDRPSGMREEDLRQALAAGWHIGTAAMRYAAVGGGSYHWVARDAAARRWFVTVDDLDDKPWLGDSRPAVLAGLRAAMDTTVDLRRDAGLAFVAAPEPGPSGATVQLVDERYAVTLFRFVRGRAGRFGAALPLRERAAMVDMLAALHRATPVAGRAAVSRVELPRRAELERTLGELGRPWQGGPFAEPARALLAATQPRIRDRLTTFDQLAGAARAAAPVITHGEPHPGNVLRVTTRSPGRVVPSGPDQVLVDWDTDGLGPPERDLWFVTGAEDPMMWRYAELTGRAVEADLLAFYRLRWALDDLSAFAGRLRAEHRRTADIEHAWLSLERTAAQLATPGALPALLTGRISC
jgi:spectinomycin phosphotransferase